MKLKGKRKINQKGITLIALVVTIIVLIILAGVSINLVLGENGILTKAKLVKEEQEISQITNMLEMYKLEVAIDNYNRVELEKYIAYIQKLAEEGKLEYKISDIDIEETKAYIVVENKYQFLLQEEANGNLKIVYLGKAIEGSFKYQVTYNIDTATTKTEDIRVGESCLAPTTFIPEKEGYTFVGWREDTNASSEVLTNKIMGKEPITLYAVFSQEITVSYDGNGATSGTVDEQIGYKYYNNGNYIDPSFTLKANEFENTDYKFVQWRLNDINGTAYLPSSSITLSSNAVMYADWQPKALTILDKKAFSGGSSGGFYSTDTSEIADLTGFETLTVTVNCTVNGPYRGPNDSISFYIDSTEYVWVKNQSSDSYSFTKTIDISTLSGEHTLRLYTRSNGASSTYPGSTRGTVTIIASD